MPGIDRPVNSPRTPAECVTTCLFQADKLVSEGLDEEIVLQVIAHRYGVDFDKLLDLWVDREWHGRP